MEKSKLNKYKKNLMDAKIAILKEMESEKEYLEYNDQGDMVDIADQMVSNDILTRLSDMDLEKLKLIDLALEKIARNENFGICEGTQKKIPEARLNHIPWAQYTMEYAAQKEKELKNS